LSRDADHILARPQAGSSLALRDQRALLPGIHSDSRVNMFTRSQELPRCYSAFLLLWRLILLNCGRLTEM
jgi:hypothetical protein